MASNAPCLCSLESTLSDYVIIQESDVISPPTEMHTTGNSSPRGVRQFVSNFFLQAAQCCRAGGWTEFPDNNDPEHSIHAHTIFLEVSLINITQTIERFCVMLHKLQHHIVNIWNHACKPRLQFRQYCM